MSTDLDPEVERLILDCLGNPVSQRLAATAAMLNRAIISAYPTSMHPDPAVLDRPDDHLMDGSACHWMILFGSDGTPRPVDAIYELRPGDPKSITRWDIYASARAPLLTASESIFDGATWPTRGATDTKLIELVTRLATEQALVFVPWGALRALRVDPSLITSEMRMRLDHTAEPDAFQLLFSED